MGASSSATISSEASPSLEQQANFYDSRWTQDANRDRLNGYQLARVAAIFESLSFLDLEYELRKKESLRVCDLGCGRGWLASQLTSVGQVTGVDLSPEGVRIAQQRWPDIQFECADILAWSGSAPFDLVISSEVIEHITEKERFVAAVKRNLKPGGFAIITTPNLRAKEAWARDGQLSQPIEEWPSLRELRQLFANDFEVLYQKTFVQTYTYLGSHRVASAPKLLKFLRRLGLLPAYQGIQSTLGVGLHQLLIARLRPF